MDIITRAIERNAHLYDDIIIKQQTWEQFERESKDKKLFVFGVGNGMDYFIRNCSKHRKLEGVIDNDIQKQQQVLGWYCAEVWQTEYENIRIHSIDILNAYLPQNVLVLVTSINFYSAIVEQLRENGISNVFVLLMMEINRRETSYKKDEEDFITIRKKYVQWCCKQEIDSRKIVMSYGEYGGHAKYITRELLKNRKDLDIVWLVYDPQMEVPEGVRLVPEKNWKRYTYEMETAKIWLFDITVQDYIIKRQGQIYIQAKHWSSITLKKFYLDDKSSCTSPQIEAWIRKNGDMMDYLLSGSEFDEESCRSGFAFKGKAVRVGSPRSDILFDKKVKGKVFDYFCLDRNAHILLYAPTYRKVEIEKKQDISLRLDFDKILSSISSKFGGDWYVFIRLHPWMDFRENGFKESEKIINASSYIDSEELVASSDIMITDYSSIMFEAAFIKKLVFLYAPDRREYIEKERDLLIDYDKLPFSISENIEELQNNIYYFKQYEYEKNLKEFFDRFKVCEDGHASERAAAFINKILGKMDENKEKI